MMAADQHDDALEWALKQWDEWVREIRSGDLSDLPRMQFEAILDGYAERLADERFDAGYGMGLRHSIRIVEIAKAEALSHDAVLARIGLRLPADTKGSEQ